MKIIYENAHVPVVGGSIYYNSQTYRVDEVINVQPYSHNHTVICNCGSPHEYTTTGYTIEVEATPNS